jgi:hypothetical protein
MDTGCTWDRAGVDLHLHALTEWKTIRQAILIFLTVIGETK